MANKTLKVSNCWWDFCQLDSPMCIGVFSTKASVSVISSVSFIAFVSAISSLCVSTPIRTSDLSSVATITIISVAVTTFISILAVFVYDLVMQIFTFVTLPSFQPMSAFSSVSVLVVITFPRLDIITKVQRNIFHHHYRILCCGNCRPSEFYS